jgi:hypothetical protein
LSTVSRGDAAVAPGDAAPILPRKLNLGSFTPILAAAVAAIGVLVGTFGGGFTAGWAAYRFLLEKAQVDEVPKGTYTLNKKLVGHLLQTQIYQQIADLVKDSTGLTAANREAWLLEAKTFVYGLNLEKDSVYVPQGLTTPIPISSPLSYIFYAQSQPNPDDQVQGTVGVLRGLQRGYSPLE